MSLKTKKIIKIIMGFRNLIMYFIVIEKYILCSEPK